MTDDDTLLLYFGDELDAAQRREVELALRDQPGLADRYAALVRDLESLRSMPAPAAGAAAHSGWHSALERHVQASHGAPARPWRTSVWALAAGLGLLAVGITVGLRLTPDPVAGPDTATQSPPAPLAQGSPAHTEDAVPGSDSLSRGLASYLHNARTQLVVLEQAEPARRAAIVETIVAHNRAFERVATQSGAHDIARVLRAFEQSLLQLGQTDPESSLRQGIDQLHFEYGAMLTRLGPRASKHPISL